MANNKTLIEQAKLVKDIKKVNEELKKLQSNLIDGDKIQLEIIAEKNKKLKELQKELKNNNKEIDKQVLNFESLDDTLISIGNSMKSNSKLIELQSDNFTKVKNVSQSISAELKAGSAANQKTQQQIVEMNRAYQSMHISIANANKEFAQGRISEEQRVSIIKEQSNAFMDVTDSIDMSKVTSEELLNLLQDMKNEGNGFAASMQKAQVNSEALDNVMSNFSGIPAMGELNTLLKTNIKDTLAFKAAVFALGAALGKAAYDYFGAPIKAAMQADKERKQNEIDTAAEISKLKLDAEFIPQQIAQERREAEIQNANQIARTIHDAQYAGVKAAHEFQVSMQQGAAQFERASKTALFGNKLGSVGYGAAQLQLAGVSAEKIASAMSAASSTTGKMPTAKMGADMSIMADRTGTSVDNIAQLNEYFQRTDKVSADVAMNMQEGMRAMADNAGISLGNLMQEVAEASKDALSYQIKSGPALAKQVAYAQSLGVSFGDVAKAGKNMVLNYKDSVKAEMQLSSLLGEQVDLSEVRAKFAAGDQAGAMEALKAQGLDPADMDMFQQEALQQALGGMDLQSISKIATGTGAQVGDLKAGKAGAANQEFLSKTQAAEQALSAKQAQISADSAIFDAKLSAKIEDEYFGSKEYAKYKQAQNVAAQEAAVLASKMKDAWLETDAYKKSLADSMKLDFVSGLKETLMSGLATILGGIAATMGGNFITKLFGKKAGAGGAGAAGDSGGVVSAVTGGAAGGGGVASAVVGGAAAGADALVPGSGAVVEGLASQVDTLQAPLEKAMTFGEKLKDLGAGLGGFIKEIGTGVGQAIKGVLQGLGQGLISLATGIVALTPGIPVILAIGAALWLAAPALEAIAPPVMKVAEVIGTVLVEALRQAGPIITSIFNGIGTIIKSIGSAISDVMNAVGDSLVKIGSIDGGNLLVVAGALIPLSAGLLALGAAELINGIMGFIGSLFGGGESIWDKLKELATFGPGLKQASDAVVPLAPAFRTLGDVGDGDNLGDLMENLKSALAVLDDKAQTTIKTMGPAIQQFGYGLGRLGDVNPGVMIPILTANLKTFIDSKVVDSLAASTPTLSAFADAMAKLQTSFTGPAVQSFMMLSTISKGIDLTTASVIKMTAAFSELSAVNLDSIRGIPWDKMTNFGKTPGGSVVLAKNANNNFTIEKNSAKNLELQLQKITDFTETARQLLIVNKNLQALIDAQVTGQEGGVILKLDGKTLGKTIKRRQENNTGSPTNTGTGNVK